MALPVPHDITDASLKSARERFDRFRLEIWQSTGAQRGHSFRVKVMGLAPVGSRRFALLSSTGSAVLRALRAIGFDRRPLEVVDEQSFPLGFTWSQSHDDDLSTAPVLVVDDPHHSQSWEEINRVLEEHAFVIVALAGAVVQAAGARAMASMLTTSDAAVVTGDDVVINGTAPPLGRFRPKQLGLTALLSYDAVGPVVGFQVEALKHLGGFSPDLGSLALVDAAWRLIEAGHTSAHVGDVVATCLPPAPEDRIAHSEWTKAKLEHLGFTASATPRATGAISWRATPPTWPSVAIVIPTRDRLDLLQRCLAGVAKSTYPEVSVVICDNDSVEPATRAFLATTTHTVVPAPGPFNYSAIVNRGVANTNAQFIVTLNNDVEIHEVDWIERLVAVAMLPNVGPVGCALKEPTGVFNHEGIAIAPYPQHLRRDRNYIRRDAFLTATREVAAVTGACTLIRRSIWDELGGLDESLAVIGNDVDLCLRASVAGYHSVYVADLELTHAESSSRGALNPPEDIYTLVARWGLFDDYVDPWFPSALAIVADQVVWRPQ